MYLFYNYFQEFIGFEQITKDLKWHKALFLGLILRLIVLFVLQIIVLLLLTFTYPFLLCVYFQIIFKEMTFSLITRQLRRIFLFPFKLTFLFKLLNHTIYFPTQVFLSFQFHQLSLNDNKSHQHGQ